MHFFTVGVRSTHAITRILFEQKALFVAGLLCAATLSLASPAFAETVSSTNQGGAVPTSQIKDALSFFNQVAMENPNPLIAGYARENLSRLQEHALPGHQVVVPLLEQPDNSLVVTTLLNDHIMATFVVDTGSSYTVITPALAHKLGVVIPSDAPHVMLATANGAIEAPIVKLKNVAIGNLKVSEVTAVVQPLGSGDDPLLSGLLGMNFFQGMDLTVKQDSLVLNVREVRANR